MEEYSGGKLISFSSHENHFLMETMGCDNPDCPCTSALLSFVEVSGHGKPRKGGLSFRIDLDVETWKESDPPERSEATARLAAEFLRDLAEDMKSELKADFDSARYYSQVLKRLSNCRLPREDVEEGLLVSFGDLVAPGEEGRASKDAVFSYSFSHGGGEYLAADLYCPKPGCKCREARLILVEKGGTPEKPVYKDRAMVSVSLKGRISVEEAYSGTEEEAEELASAWHALHPEALESFKWRYKEIKKIGRRSLSGGKAARTAGKPEIKEGEREEVAAVLAEPGRGKVGRNDPCPCGSGKKYKKCCARRV